MPWILDTISLILHARCARIDGRGVCVYAVERAFIDGIRNSAEGGGVCRECHGGGTRCEFHDASTRERTRARRLRKGSWLLAAGEAGLAGARASEQVKAA